MDEFDSSNLAALKQQASKNRSMSTKNHNIQKKGQKRRSRRVVDLQQDELVSLSDLEDDEI